MKLRPYQRNACMSAVTGLETAHTLLESPTGTGKTEMAIAISEAAVRRKAGPVLVVAPTDEIYGQMIARYQRAGWQVHADKADRHARPALAMEQALDGCKVVVVASLGTIAIRDRIERYPREGWALPLMDECFPAGTLVDGRPIETIKQGDLVRSYNHKIGRVEQRRVVRTFQSEPAALVTVYLSNGQRIVCTAGHPFYVGVAGYREAINLRRGDGVYGITTSNALHHCAHVQSVESAMATPGTIVYNLEVERNHNYFVGGMLDPVLVHNCHHAPAATWQGVREYIDQPWLGLSATPEREGMAKLWPNHVRAFKHGLMDAIEQGWLVPFEHKYAAGMSQADYEALKSADADEVGEALPAAIATVQEALGQRQGIAFWPRTRAAKQAAKFLRSLPEEITARALVGGMPRDERTLALRQYVAGTLRMLTLCQVGVEGLDVPPAAVLAIFQQTKIRSRVAQMVGRVLRPDARCLEGLDEATAEERRDAIARSSKPSAFVLSVAPPDAVDGWETPGTLLWGQLPQPVLIDIDRRQRQGKDLETARREAVQAEDDRKKEREAKRAEYERALLAAAPARAQAVANARPYELRDPAMVARDTRRQRLASAWRKWRERARQANVSAKLGHSDIGYKQASDKQAAAIAKLAAEWLREPRVSSPAGDLYREVLTWDSKTAISAQHALRMMCGHGFKQRTA
jgi:superfamily II DNA or RNA helicase